MSFAAVDPRLTLRREPHSESNTHQKHQNWLPLQTILLGGILLMLYGSIVAIASSATLQGDEGGYLENARRMIYGPYSSNQDLHLWWGPGYPLVLVPFIVTGVPLMAAKFLNAAFLAGGILYFNAVLRRYVSVRAAFVVTMLLGVYPPLMREVQLLCPEAVAFFLVCGFIYHFCTFCTGSKYKTLQFLLAALFLGWLALTKVFFGYAIASCIVVLLLAATVGRIRRMWRVVSVFSFALALCIPYLWYTYSVSGRPFYWGTSGGMQLYWMSTPYGNESGSWFSGRDVEERPELRAHRGMAAFSGKLSDLERDDAFKRQALLNIRRHPAKYMENWVANVGRLLFSYPFSFASQSMSTYFYLLPNMFVVVLFALSIVPGVLRWRAIPFEIGVLLGFAVIALAGTSLLSAYERQFRPLVPVLCLWMAVVYTRIMHIGLRPLAEAPCKPVLLLQSSR